VYDGESVCELLGIVTDKIIACLIIGGKYILDRNFALGDSAAYLSSTTFHDRSASVACILPFDGCVLHMCGHTNHLLHAADDLQIKRATGLPRSGPKAASGRSRWASCAGWCQPLLIAEGTLSR
jgi:hypothetical protein